MHFHLCIKPLNAWKFHCGHYVKDKLLCVSLRTSATSLPWPGLLIPQPISLLKTCDNMDNNYNVVAHLYLSYQTYVYSHMVLIPEKRSFLFHSNYMIHFLCAAVVSTSCFLLSYIKYLNKAWHLKLLKWYDDVPRYVSLKCSNKMY